MTSKTILVTGSNKGIGFEIVRQLAALGHEVILTARNAEKGTAAQQNLAADGFEVPFIMLDVTNKQQIEQAAASVQERFGRLDVLINNAGILRKNDQSIIDFDPAVLHDTLQTNAIAALELVRTFAPLIPPGGSIIHLSSGGGSMTDPVEGWAPLYCVSKSLLNAVTRQQAYYLAEKKIAVNAVCPGWVRTDMGGQGATRSVARGAETPVWLATAEVKETGRFFRDRKIIPW